MTWRNRPGLDPEQRFEEIENAFGLENLTDVQLDIPNLKIYFFTETQKFSAPLTLEP